MFCPGTSSLANLLAAVDLVTAVYISNSSLWETVFILSFLNLSVFLPISSLYLKYLVIYQNYVSAAEYIQRRRVLKSSQSLFLTIWISHTQYQLYPSIWSQWKTEGKFGLFSSSKRKLSSNWLTVCKNWHKEKLSDTRRLSNLTDKGVTRCSGEKLKSTEFKVKIRCRFLTTARI